MIARIPADMIENQRGFYHLKLRDAAEAAGGPVSPLPGTVVSVHVSPGDEVYDGDLLVDCLDPNCVGDPACPIPEDCDDNQDNDEDCLVDMDDPCCQSSDNCVE